MIEALGLSPLWGMLPLLVFIVLALMGKPQIVLLFISTALCMILGGVGIGTYSSLMAESLGSDLTLIGLVVLMSGALGKVLEKSGVTQTMVTGIIRGIGVKTENRAIVVGMACSLLVCGVLGTLGGGNSILAPIIIPVVASVGLSKSTVGAIFQNAGETGLIWGPLSPAVAALLALTGLSYGRMMLTAALPYGIVWLVTSYFVIRRIQKKTRDLTPYTDVTFSETFVVTKRHKLLTALFVIAFLGFIAYAAIAKLGIAYLAFVMLALAIIVGLFSGEKPDALFKTAISGMAGGLPLFFMFLLFGPLFMMMTNMGAFEALAGLFSKVVGLVGGSASPIGKVLVTILGSFVGGFGIEGAAVVQMQLTHELFSGILKSTAMPMELWAFSLIAAARLTSATYPTANLVGQMGLARSDDVKSMLKVGWAVAAAVMVFTVLYAFAGAYFLY